MVFLGDIAHGYEIMKELIYNSSLKQDKKLIPLFERACYAGSQARLDMYHPKDKVA